MRIMFDTNIYISAFVFPRPEMDALLYTCAVEHHLVMSSYGYGEFMDVLARKFPQKLKTVNTWLKKMPYELVNTQAEPESGIFTIRDMDDYPLLYSAIMSDVDVFITGDHDFDDVIVTKPEILTPAEFRRKYR